MKKLNSIFVKLITGTVIAAGAAVLAFKALDSDSETKKTIKKNLKKVEIKGNEVIDNIKDKSKVKFDDVIKRISEEFDSLKVKIEKSDKSKRFEKTIKKIAADLREVEENSRPEIEALANKLSSEIQRLAQEFKELEEDIEY